MLLALAVLLIQPATVSAPSVSDLPLNSASFSADVLTPPAGSATDKVADKKEDKKDLAAKDASKDGAGKASVSNTSTPFKQVFFPVNSYLPGQTELTRVPSSDVDANAVEPAYSSSRAAIIAVQPKNRKPLEVGHDIPKMWLVLGAVEHGAATFDAWSTRRNITSGVAHESDPMLKPFANSGALYAAVQVAPVLFDILSRQMMRSSHPLVRRMWWLPQSASAAASIFSGAHNMAIH